MNRRWEIGDRRSERREHPPRPLAGVILVAFSLLATPLSAQGADVGTRAPVLTVAALDGSSVRLDAATAKRPMLLEFWATWCEVCDALLPKVRLAHQRFGDRVDFYGVNVTVNESKRRVERWVERERPPYRTLYDETGSAVRAFGAPVTSYIVVVDAAGVIRYTGSGSDQDLLAVLTSVVGR